MKVSLAKSPNKRKKYRIFFEDGNTVDFGAHGYSDYTIHRDASRMRAYVRRHGGKIKDSTLKEPDFKRIHELMLEVVSSSSENWQRGGIDTPGFWSRWLLWSMPSLSKAITFVESKFNLQMKTDL